jgi:NAD(P)-dependent dehydrogenase (short-subunit alcohol dehydrogenase family)
MTRIWNEELANTGVAFLSLDPSDMDTPMHAAAVPDGDRSGLKRPEIAAAELVDATGNLLASRNSAWAPDEVHR